MSKFDKSRRFQMERLEARQMMARDTGAGLDGIPLDEPPGTEYEPPISEIEPPAYVGPIRNYRPNSPMTWAPLPHFEPNVPESPTGDVTAKLIGGNLYLNETPGFEGFDNGVLFTRLAGGRIRISGIDPNNSGAASRINGAEFVEFVVTGSLFINLGDGANTVHFEYNPESDHTFQDVVINGGADVDRIFIESLKTLGSLHMNLGAGGNSVLLQGGGDGDIVIGDGFGWDAMSIHTGGGADRVTIRNGAQINGALDIQTYASLSENDLDFVYFDFNAFVLRDVNISMGGGDDFLHLTEPNIDTNVQPLFLGALETHGSLIVDMGAGNDVVFMRGIKTHGDLTVLTGAGADKVTIDHTFIDIPFDEQNFVSSVGGNLEIQTYDSLDETDRDEVRIIDATVLGTLRARLGGGMDYFLLDRAEIIKNDFDLDMGDGDDTADISGFVLDEVMARMGEGHDVLTLGKTYASRLTADGGNGYDTLKTTDKLIAPEIYELAWEMINGLPTWQQQLGPGPGGGVIGTP